MNEVLHQILPRRLPRCFVHKQKVFAVRFLYKMRTIHKLHRHQSGIILYYFWQSQGFQYFTPSYAIRQVKSKATLGDRAFAIAVLSLWNSLPTELRSITCVNSFKAYLKTFLSRQAYTLIILSLIIYQLAFTYLYISFNLFVLAIFQLDIYYFSYFFNLRMHI